LYRYENGINLTPVHIYRRFHELDRDASTCTGDVQGPPTTSILWIVVAIAAS